MTDQTVKLTLRVPRQLADQLATVAAVEGVSVNTWLADTAKQRLNVTRRDPGFQSRLEAYKAEQAARLRLE
jgi:hypothetical protein